MRETRVRTGQRKTNHHNPGVLPAHARRGFRPTDRQQEIHDLLLDGSASSLTLVGYGGAMGGGKTRAIVELAIDAALMHPGNNVLVARQHYTDLSTTTMKEFARVCPERYIRRRQAAPTPLVRLGEPGCASADWSTVNFRHLTDWSGLGSQEYGAVLIDEAGEVAEEAAQMLLTRLRHPAQLRRWFVAASNPWPGWFERWFAKRELDEEALGQADGRVVFVPARIEDNPHLPERYADQQRALHRGDWVERFIEGRFDAFAGQIYPQFDAKVHFWSGPLPPFARYAGGLDFGGLSEDGHCTAGVVAGITDRRAPCGPNVLIRLDEFEERGADAIQRLEAWQRRWIGQVGRIRWCADRTQSAWIDHQRRQGMNVVASRGGEGSVSWGISLVQEGLAAEPPRSFYTANLRRFPGRMREYRWESNAGGNPKPVKRNDDLLDADRYMHELLQQVPRSTSGPEIVILNGPRGKMAHWPGR
ncbi:MAG: phage terminase large subunit [Chloroflexota bacterium]|nr:phage terminase large subunit [Chloroflexota bacterium]